MTNGQSVRFSFERPPGGCLVPRDGSFKIRIGQIVQRDGDGQAEQILDVAEQCRLDLITVAHQQIGGPEEPDRRHGFEILAQKFAEGTTFAQPAPGRDLTAGCRHSADQEASDGVALDAVQAEIFEDLLDSRPVHRGEAGSFDANGARSSELQGGDVNLGVDRDWRGGSGWRDRRWSGDWFAGTGLGHDEAGGSFPTDDAALKLLYLAIRNAGLRWRRPKEWTEAMNQFAILFGDRFVLPRN